MSKVGERIVAGLTELAEHLDLQLEPLGYRLDDQPRVAHRLGEVRIGRDLTGRGRSQLVGLRGNVLRHEFDSCAALCVGGVMDSDG